MYRHLRNLLFNFDAESVHHLSMNTLKILCENEFIRQRLSKHFQYKDQSLNRQVFGLHFENPLGLGAGFDKNALFIREIETLGFGFAEIGTVTPLPQPGNDKPRLFRLPKDGAIINRMGFNNDGVKVISERLRNYRKKIIVGGNIGKNKDTSNKDAWKDYETCMTGLFDCVDYFVVNVSSPNTPGLRELQEKDSLRKILSHLQHINKGRINPKPLLLKIAPDLTVGQLDDIAELAMEVKLNGLVATNTTIDRSQLLTNDNVIKKIGYGGLSGKPLKETSTKIVQYLHRHTNGEIPIIASGGIFTSYDAKEKIAAGAKLIQVWTGFVYEGPSIAKLICKGLV